jgi:hypothetical protein
LQSLRYRKRAATPVGLEAGTAATSHSDFDFPAASAPTPNEAPQDRPQKFRKPSVIGGGSGRAWGDARGDAREDAHDDSGGGGVGNTAVAGEELAAAKGAAVAAAAAAAMTVAKSSSRSSISSSSSGSRSDIFNAIQTLPLTMSTSERAPSTIKRVLTNENTCLSPTRILSLITAPSTTPNPLSPAKALPARAITEENDTRFPPLPPRLPFQSGPPEDIGDFSSADEEDVESEDVFIITRDIAASTPTSLPSAITDLVLAYDGQRKEFNNGAGHICFNMQLQSNE